MAEKAALGQGIVREDFRRVRKGWDPHEVRQHLMAVAELFDREPTESIASSATERVGAIVEAAEKSAEELERDARERARAIADDAQAQADTLLSEAREEAETITSEAHREAEELIASGRRTAERRVRAAREAVAVLLKQTEVLLREEVEREDEVVAASDAAADASGDGLDESGTNDSPAADSDELLEQLKSGAPIPAGLTGRSGASGTR